MAKKKAATKAKKKVKRKTKAAPKKSAKRSTGRSRAKRTPYQQLLDAGLVSAGMLTTSERNTINKMTGAEIRLLIKLAGKLGQAKRPQARPNFPL